MLRPTMASAAISSTYDGGSLFADEHDTIAEALSPGIGRGPSPDANPPLANWRADTTAAILGRRRHGGLFRRFDSYFYTSGCG